MGANRPPANPFLGLVMWASYWADRGEPWVLSIASVGLAIGGGLFSTKPVLSVLVILLSAFLPVPGLLWRRRAADDEVTSDARELLLEESLRPLLQLAASTTSKPRSERAAEAAFSAAQVAKDLRNAFNDIAGVRVVVFRVSDEGTAMDPLELAGRQQRPGPFIQGTGRGDKAFAVLAGPRPYVMVEDLAKARVLEWEGTGEGYATFISAPIRSNSEGFGMLTLDAPRAGSLDARHGATLALFAAALGVLFAEAARSGGGAR